jgi:MFS family permease
MHFNIHRLIKIKNEREEIYLNNVIETFTKALIGIFIPIYLLEIGFSFQWAIMFFIVNWSFHMITSPYAGAIASRLGLKHTILYRIPFLIVFFFMLLALEPYPSMMLLIATALVGGFSLSLYWVPLNAEFVKNSDAIHRGEEVGHLIAFPRITTIFAPTLGALILGFLGFNILFIIVILLIVFSVAPFFATGDYKGSFKFSFRQTKLFMDRRFSAIFFLRGFMVVSEMLMWPLFIYFTLGNVLDVGIAASLWGLGIALFTLIIGKVSDRTSKRKIMKIGGLGYGITWFVRIFVSTPIEVYLISFIGGIFITVIALTVFSQFCDASEGRNILQWVSFRELWLGVGKVAFLVAILLLFAGFEWVFLATGIAGLLLLLL